MVFTILTFLAAFGVAGVAEWFSVVGIMSIYAGAAYNAGLVMGLVLGGAKLVTISWIYRNWNYASWKLKGPLIYFSIALMVATSIGVFGFLTKAHLEQGAATVDNSAKVERLDQQIAREKSSITDNEKVIGQLDTAINSYLGKDNADRALSVRRAQAPQRKQLRADIDVAQKRIDRFSEEKLKLTSQVRALQLEVGPIRYISELFYGIGGNESAKVESAVKLFTLLIVSTLDPLAVMLLIAANHTLLRLQNEKKKRVESDAAPSNQGPAFGRSGDQELSIQPPQEILGDPDEGVPNEAPTIRKAEEVRPEMDISFPLIPDINEEDQVNTKFSEPTTELDEDSGLGQNDSEPPAEISIPEEPGEHLDSTGSGVPPQNLPLAPYDEEKMPILAHMASIQSPTVISTPNVSRISTNRRAESTATIDKVNEEIAPQIITTTKIDSGPEWVHNESIRRELLGSHPHFIPQKLNEEKIISTNDIYAGKAEESIRGSVAQTGTQATQRIQEIPVGRPYQEEMPSENNALVDTAQVRDSKEAAAKIDKYPKALSWVKEFKGN